MAESAVVTYSPVMPAVGLENEVTERICRAALTCFERYGVKKTSLEDIAQTAGCSRATVYRYFDGKDSIILETLRREASDFFMLLAGRLARLTEFEALFAEAAATSAEVLGSHRLLNVLIEVEPQLLLPHVAFGPSSVVEIATGFLAPYISKLVDMGDIGPVDAVEAAEWVVRTVLSYLLTPSRTVDLSDRGAMVELARRYLRPALGHGKRNRFSSEGENNG